MTVGDGGVVEVDTRAESMEMLEEMLDPLLPSVDRRPREDVRADSNVIDMVATRASRWYEKSL